MAQLDQVNAYLLLTAPLLPEPQRSEWKAELGKLARGATTLAFENRCRTKDGTYRLLDWTAVPDGGHIHAIARDVTADYTANASGTIPPENGMLSEILGELSRLRRQQEPDSCRNFVSGSDGTRTRDLRRDRPAF